MIELTEYLGKGVDTKQPAIICDLDGTLALFGDKNPFDRDFENDEVNIPVAMILQSLQFIHGRILKLIFLSGRNDKFKAQTEQFLRKAGFSNYELHMRRNGDYRKDDIFKEEVYNEKVKDNYKVLFVIDDRLSVCRFWYKMNLFCFNVNQGLIEF